MTPQSYKPPYSRSDTSISPYLTGGQQPTLDSTVTLTAFSSTVLSSRNTAQIPSACPMTGIRVASLILLTSSFPPRGITRSIYRSWARSEDISERVETDWIRFGGRCVRERAEVMRVDRRVEVWRDSLPPLRIAALPVRS